ncbi:MAG: hypothetical protein GX616_27540 [Planctomycetes bacterium]|nr:hypothetical protein [Planctomycetota bacterium]
MPPGSDNTPVVVQADAIRWRLISARDTPPAVVSIDPNAGQNDQVINEALV